MDEHRTVSVSRTYVPNEYVVWLSPEDRERYEGVEREVIDELSRLPARARARASASRSSRRPEIEFRTDERLALGEFGIQARLVRAGDAASAAEQADHGHTMVYSTADARAGAAPEERAARARPRRCSSAEGKRYVDRRPAAR